MSIIISKDLQLLTYIYVWNIYKNLFFNYRRKLGKNMQIKPKKLHATQELSQPHLLPCPCFADRDFDYFACF